MRVKNAEFKGSRFKVQRFKVQSSKDYEMRKRIAFDKVVAEEYDLWYQTEEGRHISFLENKLMLDLLKPQAGEKFLDIGCGTGNHLLLFLEKKLLPFGMDSSFFMLKEAKKKTKGKNFLILACAESLPFSDKCFDTSIIFTTLEFCDDPIQVLKEAERVTRERIFLGVLNSYSLVAGLRRIKGRFKSSIYNKARFYNIRELKKLIEGSFRFISIEWGGANFFPWINLPFFRWLDKRISLKKNPFSTFLGILIEL